MARAAQMSSAEKARLYRQRRRDAGVEEVLFQLPGHAVAMIDELKIRHGLRNRSQVLLQLIEERGSPPST
jgi:hypothetical protein